MTELLAVISAAGFIFCIGYLEYRVNKLNKRMDDFDRDLFGE